MSTMTKHQRVSGTFAGETTGRPPFALWGHDFLREWSPDDLVAQTLERTAMRFAKPAQQRGRPT